MRNNVLRNQLHLCWAYSYNCLVLNSGSEFTPKSIQLSYAKLNDLGSDLKVRKLHKSVENFCRHLNNVNKYINLTSLCVHGNSCFLHKYSL